MKYYTFVLLEWGWGKEGGIRTLSHTGAVISIIYFQAHKWKREVFFRHWKGSLSLEQQNSRSENLQVVFSLLNQFIILRVHLSAFQLEEHV